MEHRAVIALGSNISPEQNIQMAIGHLARQTRLLGLSRFYRTAPIGDAGPVDFINGAVLVATDLAARDLKAAVLQPVETALGRRREANKYAARTIDLDILIFDDDVIDEPALRVPDPDLRTRAFLAAALLDVVPGAVLPDGTVVAGLHDAGAMQGLNVDTEFTGRMKELYFS